MVVKVTVKKRAVSSRSKSVEFYVSKKVLRHIELAKQFAKSSEEDCEVDFQWNENLSSELEKKANKIKMSDSSRVSRYTTKLSVDLCSTIEKNRRGEEGGKIIDWNDYVEKCLLNVIGLAVNRLSKCSDNEVPAELNEYLTKEDICEESDSESLF